MMSPTAGTPQDPWPELDFEAGHATIRTLHLWSQIVGKVRFRQSPWINHSWHATFYVTARGFSSSLIPHENRAFELEFDLIDHRLNIIPAEGQRRQLVLEPRSVASFYEEFMAKLRELDLFCDICAVPNELADATPFPQDTANRPYEPEQAHRFWRALVQTQRVFTWFRAGFSGKASPVHLFWGSFDLAVTRFSGREAPPHPGGAINLPDPVTREAYSHEVSSAGFWAGDEKVPYAAYYSYAYPAPPGFESAQVEPSAAVYDEGLGEFLLPYEVVRTSASPDETLASFLETTYRAAADLGGWDREHLERLPIAPT